jgi:hypothetical protein
MAPSLIIYLLHLMAFLGLAVEKIQCLTIPDARRAASAIAGVGHKQC